MKETLFQLKKKGLALAALRLRNIARRFLKNTLSREESFLVPIVINNRNRYTYLKNLVDWLSEAGYKNIYILDNDSTYPPLLEYYRITKARVVFLKKNAGYKALWGTQLFNGLKKGYYVYSDPDLLPGPDCPADVVYQLHLVLQKYPEFEKAGVALKLDDLPEHYSKKNDVIGWEKKHWSHSLEKDVYDAPVDTTFALYRPLAYGNAEECRACRLGGVYSFLHLPWYENDLNPGEEDKYYKDHIQKDASFWIKNK
jgi:hypothetical protein